MAASLLLAACEARQGDSVQATNITASDAPTAAKSTAPAPAPVLVPPAKPSAPMSVATLAGVWRVTGVDGGGDVARDDPRLIGALMEVQREQLAWSYRPDKDFPGDTLCDGPWIGPIEGKAGDATLHPRFAAAMARLGLPGTLDAVPYEIECQGGGRWGPGQIGTAHLYLLGPRRMLMSWFGDSVLLLEQMQRPGAAPATDLPLKADDAVR